MASRSLAVVDAPAPISGLAFVATPADGMKSVS